MTYVAFFFPLFLCAAFLCSSFFCAAFLFSTFFVVQLFFTSGMAAILVFLGCLFFQKTFYYLLECAWVVGEGETVSDRIGSSLWRLLLQWEPRQFPAFSEPTLVCMSLLIFYRPRILHAFLSVLCIFLNCCPAPLVCPSALVCSSISRIVRTVNLCVL